WGYRGGRRRGLRPLRGRAAGADRPAAPREGRKACTARPGGQAGGWRVSETNGSAKAAATKPGEKPRQHSLKFRTDALKSSYCNMANATSTREEVVLNFGVNQNWDQPGGA